MKNRSAIVQMYYGERGTQEGVILSKEYRNAFDTYYDLEKELEEKLKAYPELSALYEKTRTAVEAVNSEEAKDYYAEGFRFGVLLGMDIIKNTEEE